MLNANKHSPRKAFLWSFALFMAVSQVMGDIAYPIDLQIEVLPVDASWRVFENPVIKVRIVNSHPFTVIIPSFDLAYNHPEVQVRGPDGIYHRLYYGAHDSARHPPAVVIEANSSFEYERFLYSYYSWERWPNEPGVFRIRGYTHISSCQLAPDGERITIAWDFPDLLMRILPWRTLDRNAYEFLRTRLAIDPSDLTRARAPILFRIHVFFEFLMRFGESAYAPEIRWETAKLLLSELGNDRIPDEEVPRMVDLFDECIRACLGKGGAYAEGFLRWDMDKGGNRPMGLAIKYKRIPLMDRIVGELDKHHPEDEPAKLWRHAHVAGYKQSGKAARVILESIVERFPDSRYAKAARNQIATIDRKGWPPDRSK